MGSKPRMGRDLVRGAVIGLVVGVALGLAVLLLGGTPGFATALVPGPTTPGAAGSLADRPNVIFIVADALRADRLGIYGHEGNLTPYLDALAREGVLYRNTSAQASWTKPSVATMLTSLYPSSHKALVDSDLLPDAVATLPEVLSAAGYHTAGFTTNIFTSAQFNFQQGYDEYTFMGSTHPFLATRITARFGLLDALHRLPATIQTLATSSPENRYQDAAVLNHRALAWLEENRDTPFFLFLHYMDPHQPYYDHAVGSTGSSGIVAQNVVSSQADTLCQLYDGEVAYLDAYLGALFDALKRQGLYRDTLIVFTADHGEEFQEHGGWGHGRTLYEEQLHVPLIVKYPGKLPGGTHAGARDVALARSLDLAPTVLDVVGVPVPETMQGVSLRPGADVTRAEVVFAEVNRQGHVLRAIRTRNLKLVIANEGNPKGLPTEALFDLQKDPGEQENLALDRLDAVRLLRAALDQTIAFAEGRAVAGQPGELDAATRERLRQLGY